MKRLRRLLLFVVIICAGLFGYAERERARDWLAKRYAPQLPIARRFQTQAATPETIVGEQPSLVEGGVARSQHFLLVSSSGTPRTGGPKDPFVFRGVLPKEINLDVPFTSQAPTGDWNLPYQEACEEASAIMVDGYYRGKSGKIPPAAAKKMIDALVAFEQQKYGEYKDTDAIATARFIRDYFAYTKVLVRPLRHANEIKTALANGYPVIVPASGKQLGNPNFRNGGPTYHMLVVKGYTKNRFITHDPGTRRGADYLYTFDTLLRAAHDWNNGDVLRGKPMLIVVLPNPS